MQYYNVSDIIKGNKPTAKDTGRITNQMRYKKNQRIKATREQFAKDLKDGRAVTQCLTRFKISKTFMAMSHIMLDFDNPMVTIDKTIDKLNDYRIDWSFIYKTPSYTESHQKHRVVIFFPYPILDADRAENLMEWFKHFFPEADQKPFGLHSHLNPPKKNTSFIRNPKNSRGYLKLQLSEEQLENFINIGSQFKKNKTTTRECTKDIIKSGKLRTVSQEGLCQCPYYREVMEGKDQEVGFPVLAPTIIPFLSSVRIKGGKHPKISALPAFEKRARKVKLGTTGYDDCKERAKSYIENGNHIQNCKNSGCPHYKKDCKLNDIQDIVSRGKVYLKNDIGITLEEAREMLDKTIKECTSIGGLKIVYAPPGVGKTWTIIKTLKEATKDTIYIVASPLHEINNKEYKDYLRTKRFVHPDEVKNKEYNEYITRLTLMGVNDKKKKLLIKEYLGKDLYAEWESIQDHNNKVIDSPNHLITTHEMMYLKGEEIIRRKKEAFKNLYPNLEPRVRVIFDEDPSEVFYKSHTFSYKSFNKYVKGYKQLNILKDLEFINQSIEDESLIPLKLGKKRIKKLKKIVDEHGEDLKINILSLLDVCIKSSFKDSYIVKKKDKVTIYQISKFPFTESIIFSATPKIEIYRDILKINISKIFEMPNIKDMESGAITKKGKEVNKISSEIILDKEYSYSKNSLKTKEGRLEYTIEEAKNFIKEGNPKENYLIITYKGLEDEIKEAFKDYPNVEVRHYFNSIGINDYKGYNLILIGTPYPNHDKYELLAYFKYGNGYKEYLSTGLKEITTDRGVTSEIYTYNNSDYLENLYNKDIKEELIQSYGRCRSLSSVSGALIFSNISLY